MTSEFASVKPVLDPATIQAMTNELAYLVRICCKAYSIGNFRNRLFLHDSTPIEYENIPIKKIEDFIELVNRYWDYFPNLMRNLVWDDESLFVESNDRISGPINTAKTIAVRTNHGNRNVVYSVTSKNIFVPENLLLSSVLLGINIIANRFKDQGLQSLIDHYRGEHNQSLQRIIEYSSFLLKDKLATRLLHHYLSNHEGIDSILVRVKIRLDSTKLKDKYFPLLQFVMESNAANWKLDESKNSLRDALTAHFESISQDKLYEMWVLFKILELFAPIRQVDHRIFENSAHRISISYQPSIGISWITRKYDLDGIEVVSTNVRRAPDIVINKNGQDIAVVDAKCMDYSDIEDDKQEPGPDRNIANQMLVYLDYVSGSKWGAVLFADKKIRGDVCIDGELRRIDFLNCYPFSESSKTTFDRIRSNVK